MTRGVARKRGELRLSELADVCVLYPGDLREFGTFVLKAFAARDQVINARSRGSVQRSRPTLYGLVQDFTQIVSHVVDPHNVCAMLEARGFDLRAVVECDEVPENELAVPLPHGAAPH